MSTLYVSSPLPGDAVARLREGHDVVVGEAGRGVTSPSLDACAERVEGLLALLTDRIDEGLLARCPRLRVVANMAVGVDNVDRPACRARGVAVTNTPDVLTEATADFTFALLLAAARRVVEGDAQVRTGQFEGWRPDGLLGQRVHGAALGIVGLGRIGQAVARRARGFGMHVFYTQPRRLPEGLERALGATYTPVDELFAHADYVTLHCPLTEATRGIVSTERLGRMKATAVLVNTARGPCVDERALADALARRAIGAAALDVFAEETAHGARIDEALLRSPHVVLAPHAASAETATRQAMATRAADNLLAFFSGRPLPSAVLPRP